MNAGSDLADGACGDLQSLLFGAFYYLRASCKLSVFPTSRKTSRRSSRDTGTARCSRSAGVCRCGCWASCRSAVEGLLQAIQHTLSF